MVASDLGPMVNNTARINGRIIHFRGPPYVLLEAEQRASVLLQLLAGLHRVQGGVLLPGPRVRDGQLEPDLGTWTLDAWTLWTRGTHLGGARVGVQQTRGHVYAALDEEAVQEHGHAAHQPVVQEPANSAEAGHSGNSANEKFFIELHVILFEHNKLLCARWCETKIIVTLDIRYYDLGL